MFSGILVLLILGLGFGSVFFPPMVALASEQTTSQLYQLEFVQESNCYYGSWHYPWAVALDNTTIVVQPSNATLPLAYDEATGVPYSDINYSTIVFSVPNGTYSYSVLPKDPFNPEESGNVTVDGSGVQVMIGQFITAMGCSSTTTTSTSTASSATATVLVATTTTVVSTVSGTVTTIMTTMPGTATTVTSTSYTGVSSGLLYGVAAAAVIFMIATGVLASRGRTAPPRV